MKNSAFTALVARARARRKKGQPPIELADIAARAGISRQYLYLLLRGERDNPRPWVMERLAVALGASETRVRAAFGHAPSPRGTS